MVRLAGPVPDREVRRQKFHQDILFGENAFNKQLNILSDKGTKILPIWFMMLILPDDLMCLACGASRIDYKKFTVLHTVFRSMGVTLLTTLYFFVIPVLPIGF